MVIVGPIRKIQLETSNLCNFNCSICPREKLNVIKKVLDFKFYKLILKKTQGTKYLDLTGWGEPLLNPKILKMIEEAKKKKFYLSFTTNAYLLDKKIGLGLIESGLDEISFSLDSLSKIKESDFEQNRLVYELFKLPKKELATAYDGEKDFSVGVIYKESIVSAILKEKYGIEMSAEAVKKTASRFSKSTQVKNKPKDIRDI